MFSKSYFLVFILTFFVAGFIFLALPDKGFTQGCCEEAGGSLSCVPGQSFPQGDQQSCEQSQSGRTWLPNDICATGMMGGPQCVPGLGCCVNGPGMCVDNQEEGQCGGDWVFDTACNTIDECNPPTGCCETLTNGVVLGRTMNGAQACQAPVTEAFCEALPDNIKWEANTPCDGDVCAGDAEGCCSDIPAATTCENAQTLAECNTLGGNFTEGEQCNSVDTCGQVGCCQEDGPLCSLTNMGDCFGTWVPDDTCTAGGSDSGLCDSLIPGCCQFVGSCSDINNGQCFNAGGLFSPGDSCGLDGECGPPPPPTGCCVCGVNDCSITTAGLCPGQCDYLGDGTSCFGVNECNEVPGCCVIPGNSVECIETTQTECGNLGGVFQGPGVSCDTVAECQAVLATIPTISQWGMIGMAGLLGIFSLFIIMRRHRYNVS